MSSSALKGVDREIIINAVQANPEAYTGRKVVWGGMIIATENQETVSEIEVMETELAYGDTPENESSRGRFVVRSPGFLDAGIYKPGRLITVVGTIKGSATKKIGKMDYTYPVLEPIEMRLFDASPRTYDPYWPNDRYWPYYGPHYPYDPYRPYGPPGPINPAWPYPYRYPY